MSGEVYTMLGYLTGSLIAQQRNARYPVAYLYNGVRLPGLPDAVNGGFTNAQISGIQADCVLTIFDFVPVVAKTNGFDMFYGTGRYKVYTNGSVTWNLTKEGTVENGYAYTYLGTLGIDKIKWANFNLYRDDGTLLIEPSEPVPVYE